VRNFLLSFIVLLSAYVNLPGQTTKDNSAAPSPKEESSTREYVIGMEDVLSVNVWREPDLTLNEVVVRPDGKISLPLVNDIQADGLSTQQLQDRITEKLREFVSSPTVTVTVIRAVSQSVSIVGQVNRPGTYSLGSPITVLELLARAGGLAEFAKQKDIRIIRVENSKTLQFPFNYKDIMKGKNLRQNIVLKKGDVVLVP
jgi:polysaccharide export outer membrane protein